VRLCLAPAGSGYTKIYSTVGAFAALAPDGSIKGWGKSDSGGVNAPADKGYTKIYSNEHAFAALKEQVRLHLHNLSYPTL
jgi:hypothetical protein